MTRKRGEIIFKSAMDKRLIGNRDPLGVHILETLYIKEGMSLRDMGKLLDMDKDKLHRVLKKNNIQKKKRTRKRKINISKNYLREQLTHKTKVQVAGELGISRPTLDQYLK